MLQSYRDLEESRIECWLRMMYVQSWDCSVVVEELREPGKAATSKYKM